MAVTDMETSGGHMLGILGKLGDKILTMIALALVLLGAYALYRLGPEGRGALWAGIVNTIAWVVIAAAVPWSSKAFIRRLLATGTNWAGVAAIAAYTLVDLIAGRVLMGGWPASGWGWVAGLAALAVAGSYNYLVTEYVAEQAGG
jgi:hypothetical protein